MSTHSSAYNEKNKHNGHNKTPKKKTPTKTYKLINESKIKVLNDCEQQVRTLRMPYTCKTEQESKVKGTKE